MDTSVSPRDDFDAFANGKWKESNAIPAEYSRWGVWEQLMEKGKIILRAIVEEAAEAVANGGGGGGGGGEDVSENKGKIGAFWAAAMDEARADATAIATLQPLLAVCDGMTDGHALARILGELHSVGVHPVFGIEAEADMKNSDEEILWVSQGGLGLPDRDYYFDDEKADMRAQYVVHVAKMFELTHLADGAEAAEAAAAVVMRVETALAEVTLTRVEMRDMQRLYDKRTFAELTVRAF